MTKPKFCRPGQESHDARDMHMDPQSNLEGGKKQLSQAKILQENSQRKTSNKKKQKCHAIATTEFQGKVDGQAHTWLLLNGRQTYLLCMQPHQDRTPQNRAAAAHAAQHAHCLLLSSSSSSVVSLLLLQQPKKTQKTTNPQQQLLQLLCIVFIGSLAWAPPPGCAVPVTINWLINWF